MFKKFSEALSILWHNLGLFAAIVLTVWLPANILINLLSYHYESIGDLGAFKITMWIEGIFGPIVIGALLYALSRIKQGNRVTYGEVMAVGFRKWGALFTARFVAGLLILLGFLALIVPGVILTVRYSLLDAAVILEDSGISESRARSIVLTKGRRWQIFGAAMLFFALFFTLSFTVYLPLGLLESPIIMPVEILLDCLIDVVYIVIQIVIFLFYWESVQEADGCETSTGTELACADTQPAI